MTVKIYKSTLTALFLSASMHAVDAAPSHAVPTPSPRPAAHDVMPVRHVSKTQLPVSGYLAFDQQSKTPIGQYYFCKRTPRDCYSNMTPQRIHLTARVLKAIRDVNVRVNNAILPEEDIDQYGRSEFWAYPDSGRGDCEDYQLLKQRILRNAGFPQSALRHAVVNDLNGAGHDVLVIHTDRGDFVIDNLSNEVRTPAETGYTFRQILSPNSDYQWRTFAGRDWRAAYTAANADNEPVYRMSAAALSALEQSLHAQMLAANTFVRAQATPN